MFQTSMDSVTMGRFYAVAGRRWAGRVTSGVFMGMGVTQFVGVGHIASVADKLLQFLHIGCTLHDT